MFGKWTLTVLLIACCLIQALLPASAYQQFSFSGRVGPTSALAPINASLVVVTYGYGTVPLVSADGTPAGTRALGVSGSGYSLKAGPNTIFITDFNYPEPLYQFLFETNTVVPVGNGSPTAVTSSRLFYWNRTAAGSRENDLLSVEIDGTPGTPVFIVTLRVPDIFPFVWRDELYYVDTDTAHLFKTDGTSTEASEVISPESLSRTRAYVTASSALYLLVDSPTGTQAWVTTGTLESTRLFGSIPNTKFLPMENSANDTPMDIYAEELGLFVFATSATNSSVTLYLLDGTNPPVALHTWPSIFRIEPATTSDRLFFLLYVLGGSFELWTSDGTQEGTVRIPVSSPIEDQDLLAYGERAYFVAEGELWYTDGTAAHVIPNPTLPVGSVTSPEFLSIAGGRLFFTGFVAAGNREVYVVDLEATEPSVNPSAAPSNLPSDAPSQEPSRAPSNPASNAPSNVPSNQPSNQPSRQPSHAASHQPSSQPSHAASHQPSSQPSHDPSHQPSSRPTQVLSHIFGQSGWISGGQIFDWGHASCRAKYQRVPASLPLTGQEPGEPLRKGRVWKVQTKDWGGCGSFYYHHNDNKYLDLTGGAQLRLWLRSTTDAKIEFEIGENSDDDNNDHVFVSSTGGQWQQVSLPIGHRTSDELRRVYSPLLITIFGKGYAMISNAVVVA